MVRLPWLLLLFALLSFPSLSLASTLIPLAVPVGPCWDMAGSRFGVDPWLLYAIADTESGFDPLAVNVNKDGSVDRGLMQINSTNEPLLSAQGLDPAEVEADACLSTYVAAWLLRSAQDRYGSGSWKAIAAYNVGNLAAPGRLQAGWAYAQSVQAAYVRLAQRYLAPTTPRLTRFAVSGRAGKAGKKVRVLRAS